MLVQITDEGAAALERFRARFLEALRGDIEGLGDEQLDELAAATRALGSFVDLLQQR